MENSFSDVAVEEVWVGCMNSSDVPNHTVNIDWNFHQFACTHGFFNDEHDFLGTPNTQHWDEHFSTTLYGFFCSVQQCVLSFLSWNKHISFCTVSTFHNYCF